VTRLVLGWAFDVLGVHRVELEVLASNSRAISCYLACGFRREGVRREAELYTDGWKDFILMGILRSEHAVPSETGAGPQAKPRRPAKPTVLQIMTAVLGALPITCVNAMTRTRGYALVPRISRARLFAPAPPCPHRGCQIIAVPAAKAGEGLGGSGRMALLRWSILWGSITRSGWPAG
jgi:hypothetical protein